ncbi:MAG: hypothetical protein ACI95C_002565 [Pseudohongiellaceae bacterium]
MADSLAEKILSEHTLSYRVVTIMANYEFSSSELGPQMSNRQLFVGKNPHLGLKTHELAILQPCG